MAAVEARVVELEEVDTTRLQTVKRLCGKLGGRPAIARTDDALGEVAQQTASACQRSMVNSVLGAIGVVGTESEMSVIALMAAINEGGYLDSIWESEDVWALRMAAVKDLRGDLSIAWDAQLAMNIRDKLTISYDKMDELRFMFSHHRVGKQLRARTWLINPWDGSRVHFPEPIRPRCGALGWTHLVRAMQERHGLVMDTKGRVAQRSYARTVSRQVVRDEARGLLRPITTADPLIAVLGADGTGIGKRSLMHVATSIAPSYRDGVSVENEKNINTVATSTTDDHWGGLDETLCGGYFSGAVDALPPTSIAAEINQLICSGCVHIPAEGPCPAREVPIKVRGCFDLVAARGIRGGRGRCACHTATKTEDRFLVPAITDRTTWAQAKALLDKVPLLTSAQMRDDSHTPPEGWDFAAGPWECPRPGCGVKLDSRSAFVAARAAFLAAKGCRTCAGKKVTAARAKAYAVLHPSEQGEFEPPCTDLDMADIIIDPLHCLLLNLPKVLWKCTFGDRITNEQRELVAEYLISIGTPLDVACAPKEMVEMRIANGSPARSSRDSSRGMLQALALPITSRLSWISST